MARAKVDLFVRHPLLSFAKASERLTRQARRTNTFRSFRSRFHIPLPPVERPIFIVGTIRSGSTVLAQCLGDHPRILYDRSELTAEWCDFAGIEIARSFNRLLHCPPYTAADATDACCQRVRSGFAEFMVKKGGTRNTRFFNKNPHLWNKLPFLRVIFPDAKLIVTSRDIRSTVASIKGMWIRGKERTGLQYYVPQDHARCWGVISSTTSEALDTSRIFPGGNVTALAEYWLYAYEMIENTIEGFTSPVLVRHREFVVAPRETLAKIYESVKLPSWNYPLPVELDLSRNERWREILTLEEQRELEGFIESNRSRIERLKYADTTL